MIFELPVLILGWLFFAGAVSSHRNREKHLSATGWTAADRLMFGEIVTGAEDSGVRGLELGGGDVVVGC